MKKYDLIELLENQSSVGAAKAEGVGQGVINFHLTGCIWHIIQVTTFTRVFQIDRRWRYLVYDGHHRKYRFDATSCT